MSALAFLRRRRRWSSNDHRLGPFTYARDTYGKPFGLVLDSGDQESPGCHLRIRGFGHTLLVELPQLIRQYRLRTKATYWDAATIARLGRDWYEEIHSREFGFTYSPDTGFLQVYLGPQTDDSVTTRIWCRHLPWTQSRLVRETLLGLQGEVVWQIEDGNGLRNYFTPYAAAREEQPKRQFKFRDFDGAEIVATVSLEESEYRRGEGWFKWISVFCKPRVHRSIRIEFSAEVGREKGSWKGGTRGHGMEVAPGVLHGQAFGLYCTEHKLQLLDEVRP